MSLKVGDIVKLNSGGPLMTVHSVNQSSGEIWINCTWFGNGEVNTAAFLQDMLKKHS
ncbi:YodC family protein [Rhodovarius lipocyclicus]|uniref:YodC family protein n=1 Tax=Rhodovarius lipocyclicus TaxID=268410 RepID=UPI00135C9476